MSKKPEETPEEENKAVAYPPVVDPAPAEDPVLPTLVKEKESAAKKVEKLQKYKESEKFGDLTGDQQESINDLLSAYEELSATLSNVLREAEGIEDPFLGADSQGDVPPEVLHAARAEFGP